MKIYGKTIAMLAAVLTGAVMLGACASYDCPPEATTPRPTRTPECSPQTTAHCPLTGMEGAYQ